MLFPIYHSCNLHVQVYDLIVLKNLFKVAGTSFTTLKRPSY